MIRDSRLAQKPLLDLRQALRASASALLSVLNTKGTTNLVLFVDGSRVTVCFCAHIPRSCPLVPVQNHAIGRQPGVLNWIKLRIANRSAESYRRAGILLVSDVCISVASGESVCTTLWRRRCWILDVSTKDGKAAELLRREINALHAHYKIYITEFPSLCGFKSQSFYPWLQRDVPRVRWRTCTAHQR